MLTATGGGNGPYRVAKVTVAPGKKFEPSTSSDRAVTGALVSVVFSTVGPPTTRTVPIATPPLGVELPPRLVTVACTCCSAIDDGTAPFSVTRSRSGDSTSTAATGSGVPDEEVSVTVAPG